MELTREEIRKNRIISSTVTGAIFLLLLLVLIFFNLITPNPPFPESGGGGGQELALGMMNVGNDDIDFGSMGEVRDVVAQKTETKENIVTAEGGENVQVAENKPEVKEDKVVITPVKPTPEKEVKEPVKEKTAAEKLREKFLKNTGKNGGGIGDNEQAGEGGSPDGDPFKNGTGGTGTGSGGGDGPGTGPGSGPGFGGGKYGIDLKGRAVVTPPKLPSDTKEEGKVVVEITVDANGDVIEGGIL